MKVKVILFFLILYIVKKITYSRLTPLDTDIILAPGGYKGIYMIGICHYIKNKFKDSLRSKSITGFSCGSFNALFMRLTPELDNKFLKYLFALDKKDLSMSQFLSKTVSTIKMQFVYEDFDLRQTRIGVSTSKGLEIFQDFSSIQDVVECCRSSSFVPFVTQPDVFLFYKNKLTLDGGFHYKKVKRNKRKSTLLITSSMFGRFKDSLITGFKRPKCSYYQLYLYGYRDAQRNHTLLENYFKGNLFTGLD